jgi:Tol biopolymer transport system component
MDYLYRLGIFFKILALLVVLFFVIGCMTSKSKDEESIGIEVTSYEGGEKNITQITKWRNEDVWPSVSPDGEKIAFMSRQKTTKGVSINYDIWTVDTASNRIFTQLTNHPADECYPSWTSDSKRIFFSSPRINNNWSIWRINVGGTGAATQITSRDLNDFAPSVSPDEKKVAFNSKERYDALLEKEAGEPWVYFKKTMPYIWSTNIDGSELTQIIEGFAPIWSPDSLKIAFCSNISGNWDIWLISPDGSELTQLTTEKSDEVTPNWSPDGKKIVFASNRSGNFDIWTMNVDTSELTQLTYNKKNDAGPAWSPDGKYIYFQSNRSGNWDIWRIIVE